MTIASAFGGATLNNCGQGRLKDDALCLAPRDRRRAEPQTHAAAQSVVMANLSDALAGEPAAQGVKSNRVFETAKAGYAAAKPRRTPEEIRQDAFLREAELQHQAAQRAWVFERRKGKKPRTTDIEDAVIL